MEQHLRVFALLSRLWGWLGLVTGTSLLLLGCGALVLLFDPAAGVAARVTAVLFGVLGVVALVVGGLHVRLSRQVSDRRPRAVPVGVTLGVVDLLVPPFGTALGAYGLWVLLSAGGRRLLAPDAPDARAH
ncbi:MAG: hypothetical protein HOP14_15295 [Acidobacteria bacterium]|nr:hypothetical protein [Acidobacteriota bacterium]